MNLDTTGCLLQHANENLVTWCPSLGQDGGPLLRGRGVSLGNYTNMQELQTLQTLSCSFLTNLQAAHTPTGPSQKPARVRRPAYIANTSQPFATTSYPLPCTSSTILSSFLPSKVPSLCLAQHPLPHPTPISPALSSFLGSLSRTHKDPNFLPSAYT